MEIRRKQVAAVSARTARHGGTGKDEPKMTLAELLRQYLEHLFLGKRCEAREMIFAAHDRGVSSRKLLQKTIWPAMEQVEKLYREDHIPRIVAYMATRINRMLADQLQGFLARKPKSGRRMVVACGDGETEELGAQITGDLFEAEGWSVWFLGSGVPNDEILQFIGKVTPDILFLYGTQPAGVPGVRKLINLIREIGICEEMQVLVMGGVFNRAEGLADEVKADLFATNVRDALRTVEDHPVRIPKPDVPEPGRRRKRKRKAKVRPMRRTRVAVKA
jgi:methanogenic corrinoid protein MtbC1